MQRSSVAIETELRERVLPRLEALPETGVPRVAGEAQLKVKKTNAADRAEQGALYDLCFKKTDGTKVLPWRYDGCPHGQAIATGALDDAGALVASYAAQPRRVHYRGEAFGAAAVAQTGDVMTHPDIRSRGVFTDLHWVAMDEAQRQGWPAAWGLPNKFSGHIFFDKLAWRHAGHIGPWNFVLAASAPARAIRHQNGRLAKWGTPWAAWRGHVARRRAFVDGATIELWNDFPEDIAGLSSHVEQGFDWMVHRDAAYLRWRYLKAPCQRFIPLGIRDRAGALIAYAVVQRPAPSKRDPAGSLGFIVDLVGSDQAAEAMALDVALTALAREGAAVVRAYGMRGSHWEGTLERGGFRRPRGYKEVGAYPLLPDHPLASSTVDTSRWFFTDGDRDDEFAR